MPLIHLQLMWSLILHLCMRACMLVVVASSLVSHAGTRRSGLSLFVVVVIVSIVIGQFLDLSRARGISSVGRARA